MKQVKSISITKIIKGTESRWCSRVRFTDNTELFAGVNNLHGKTVAKESYKETFGIGLRVGGTACLAFSYNPVTRERTDHWQPLPEGWKVTADKS